MTKSRTFLISIFLGVCTVFQHNCYAQLPAWFQMGADIDGAVAQEEFGVSCVVNSDGSIIAISSAVSDGNGTNAGVVRVYEWINGWVQKGMDIQGEAAEDYSGAKISMSSNGLRIAIAARFNDGNGGINNNCGHVRVYEWSGSAWVVLGNDIDGTPLQALGLDVSLSGDGNTLAVSSIEGIQNNPEAKVQVFSWNGSFWIAKGPAIIGNADDAYGHAVDINFDGTILAVGADQYFNGTGAVFVYEWNGINWTPRSGSSGAAQFNYYGQAVSLSNDGTTLAVGAPGYDVGISTDRGRVIVYKWNGANYNLMGQAINGEETYNNTGRRVSLSDDGLRVAMWAPRPDSGEVRVFDFNGTSWFKLAKDISGEFNYMGDNEGDIALSNNGMRLLYSDPRNDQAGINAGHARIYQIAIPTPCQSNVIISTTPCIQPSFESMDWVQTSGTVIVPAGNTVRFDADTSGYVKLNPGFTAVHGSVFVAMPYNGCQAGTPNRPQFEEDEKENDPGLWHELHVYPNPTTGSIYIDAAKDLTELFLFDITGHLLIRTSAKEGFRTEISLNDFGNGIYIIEAKGFKPVKIVKY